MQEYIITNQEKGQRLDKYVKRILPEAPSSFIYKMLRKKNITLNGHKAEGKEAVAQGDSIKLFLSDETFQKMGGVVKEGMRKDAPACPEELRFSEADKAYAELTRRYPALGLVYEDENIAAAYKPAGVLSQKAAPSDLSLNEWFLGLLHKRGEASADSCRRFMPSVQNRLDRNTEGLVLLAKILPGSHLLTSLQREHRLKKYYRMIVLGKLETAGVIEGYLAKDEKANTVRLFQEQKEGTVYTRTEYRPLSSARLGTEAVTLVEAQLITGKTHQLRAHFASIGHPILGDPKYGTAEANERARQHGVRAQLLLCQRVEFPPLSGEFEELSCKIIACREPGVYTRVLHAASHPERTRNEGNYQKRKG